MNDSVVFQASIEELTKMLLWVEEKLLIFQIQGKNKKNIELALEEILVNIITHAYPHSAGILEIWVSFDKKEKLLEFKIVDQGKPFNPLKYDRVDVTSQIDRRMPGGLGIHLLKQVCDDITYMRINDSNILSIKNKIGDFSG